MKTCTTYEHEYRFSFFALQLFSLSRRRERVRDESKSEIGRESHPLIHSPMSIATWVEQGLQVGTETSIRSLSWTGGTQRIEHSYCPWSLQC